MMFERYTEKARQVIFFARYEASQFGSPSIETEHLLLGLLRQDKALTNRLGSSESIRKQIEERFPKRAKISTSVDLPLSQEAQRAIAYSAEEAKRLNHKHIGTEHLLLGLLREEKCFAADILHERGLRLSLLREEIAGLSEAGVSNRGEGEAVEVRRRISVDDYLRTIYRPDCDYVDGEVQERNLGERDHSEAQKKLILYLGTREQQWGVTVAPELRIQVGPGRFRVPDVCVTVAAPQEQILRQPPLLCIEILSPADRMMRVRDRVDDYLKMGVPHIWVLDPQAKAAYSITPAEGWREEKEVLRTANPALEMPLSAVFA